MRPIEPNPKKVDVEHSKKGSVDQDLSGSDDVEQVSHDAHKDYLLRHLQTQRGKGHVLQRERKNKCRNETTHKTKREKSNDECVDVLGLLDEAPMWVDAIAHNVQLAATMHEETKERGDS